MALGKTSSLHSLHTSPGRFAATRWSVVLAAADPRGGAGTVSKRALADLIQAYWMPLHSFVRRQGEAAASAEDIVQDFFAALLEKQYLAQVDRSKGKFRSFLLAAMQHFLSKERDKRRAKKRGGAHTIIALDGLSAEARYALEPADNVTPERLYERQWALTVLELVLARLRKEYEDSGKGKLYKALEPCLTQGAKAIDYCRISKELGIAEGSARVAAHRIRRRYRDLLRREIAQTVNSPDQVEEEIAYLLKCL